ncbi:UNVERIFIED_ORG: hypothetical protein B5F06_06705 [Lacrimispora saccharolytica]
MRSRLIILWRKLTRVKALTPLIVFIRYFAGTNMFNTVLDFWERNISHTSYAETQGFMDVHSSRIKRIMQGLADEKSVEVYGKIWKYRASHDRGCLKGIVDQHQYFDRELIHLGNRETFVDCGAYKGDTVKAFLDCLADRNQFELIAALEPDPYNFRQLEKTVKRINEKRIECYNLGSWDKKEKLRFRSNTEEGCMVTEEGDLVIEADSIDSIIGNRPVSFIKMDVEGAELKSLMGAERVIKENSPRLAISIYHSDRDMVEIPEYIMKKYPFYRIYIRHYTWFYADTVLYAIPGAEALERGERK